MDRLVIKEDITPGASPTPWRTAANLAGGLVIIDIVGQDKELMFSQNYACDDCGVSIEELTPRLFSFNSPYGACPACTGLGTQLRVDPDIIIPNHALSILEGCHHGLRLGATYQKTTASQRCTFEVPGEEV